MYRRLSDVRFQDRSLLLITVHEIVVTKLAKPLFDREYLISYWFIRFPFAIIAFAFWTACIDYCHISSLLVIVNLCLLQ
jgi:hypothetical protein